MINSPGEIKMYSGKIMELFTKPQFVGVIDDASGKGSVGNPTCGDIMEVYVKIEEKDGKEIISDVKYKTFGCVAAVASTEALCHIIKGKTVEEALAVTKQDIIDFMGGKVPAVKIHCSILASDGLKKAIDDYRNKSK